MPDVAGAKLFDDPKSSLVRRATLLSRDGARLAVIYEGRDGFFEVHVCERATDPQRAREFWAPVADPSVVHGLMAAERLARQRLVWGESAPKHSGPLPAVSTIKSWYYGVARGLGAPKRYVTFATKPSGEGDMYVERDGDGYAYVGWDRGWEFERRRTRDPNELLYWLVSGVALDMACEYERAHRKEGEYSHRLLREKYLELLARVNPRWAECARAEYADE